MVNPKRASTSGHDSDPSASDSRPPSNRPKQQDAADSDSETAPKEEVKIYKTISRVHRACNACRKQKARCDGPENPPCRRCKQIGIECIFEKPPKDASGSSSAGGADAGASSDRIRILETQMSGMQSMISELVASIKANTSAMGAQSQQSPASTSSPLSSRQGRQEQNYQQNMPLQQQQQQQGFVQPPHHQPSQHGLQQQDTNDALQRYAAEGMSSAPPPQRPPHVHSQRSFESGSRSSSAPGSNAGSLGSIPVHTFPGYPLQQQPNAYSAGYGHNPSQHAENLLQQQQQQQQQQQPDFDRFDPSSQQSASLWNAGLNQSTSAQSHDAHARGQSGSNDRGRPLQQWQQQQHLLATSSSSPSLPQSLAGRVSSNSPKDAMASGASGGSGWTPPSSSTRSYPPQPPHVSRRWTASSDRAGSHGTGNESTISPSDGLAAGDDGHDISNDQLSAPIEALRGLADAAAAAAAEESEGHTSNESGDEKNAESDKNAKGDKDMPSLQLVDEGGKRANFASPSDASDAGQSPRKRRRGDTIASSPSAASGVSAGGFGGKAGAAGVNPSASGSINAGSGGATAGLSPSAAGGSGSRSGRMEAPGLVTSAPGDLVTLGLVNESDAMRLFETFQRGVPKFISIFHLEDESMTTEEEYHYVRTTSYFLFNVMLAIGAKVECGGKSPSRLYQTCMAQAKRNAKDTMFSPVAGKAAVQAMVLLAAYSENGWLPLGLSIRMAQELGLDRSFQKLMSALPASGYIRHPQPPPPPKHMTFYHNSPQSQYTGSPGDVNSVGGESYDGKNAAGANAVAAIAVANGSADAAAKRELEELKDLARGARLWFFLFLFDHQASYGAGRPAMLSKHYVRNCRAFLSLNYPLTVKTDARFISTLELLIIRETHYDAMAPYDQPVDSRMLTKMRKVTEELNEWHQYWSADFESRGYGQDTFFQQSLVLQCASAELYLSCTALRGIRDANDADQMGPEQKELIIQATRAADTCLSISVNSKEYREMLGWAPHYTHVTAAFACVFLIKIARLFPRQVDTYGIFSNAERLASRLAEVPAGKYARVIRILLAQAWKKIADLSPAIGLYAALGAEGTRPGAITPAEIKSGGPSDSGISLLYKLLQEHQSGLLEDESMGEGQQGRNSGAEQGGGGEHMGGSGTRTPRWLEDSSKWLTAGISSPSVSAGLFSGIGGVAGSGTMSPTKAGVASTVAGMHSHRGSIAGFDIGNMVDGSAWSSFLTPHTPSASTAAGHFNNNNNEVAHHPIQLPVWMQESTGGPATATDMAGAGFGDAGGGEVKTSPSASRSWGHQDHYQSPVPHSNANAYTSPSYQTPQPLQHQQHRQQELNFTPAHHQGHRHSNSLGVPPQSPSGGQMGQQATPTPAGGGGGGLPPFSASTNFDSVLSDLGLPLDGLDGLFGDLPINAPTGQSNYSV